MPRLTMPKRDRMAPKEFAGGGPKGKKGFPMNDKTHDRLAISGATRSYDAGDISKGKEESIKSEAREKLGGGSRGSVPRGEHHQASHREPRNHAEFERMGNPGRMSK